MGSCEAQRLGAGPARYLDMAESQAHDQLEGWKKVGVTREDDMRVVLLAERQVHEVDGQRNIDALLLRRQSFPVPKLAADHVDPPILAPGRSLGVVRRGL